MSINKYQPHLLIIPEDRADEQLANGFLQHPAMDRAVGTRAVQVVRPAGGWGSVIEVFEREYLPWLQKYAHSYVVMLVDFDEQDEHRRVPFEKVIPGNLKDRVFVVGSKNNPESLKRELKMSFEEIGRKLAEDCDKDDVELWHHAHLIHNSSELERMVPVVKGILFQRK